MRTLLTVGLVLAIAPGASAATSDSLLSGYGGPGDGEQALLGQTLIRDGGGSAPAASAPARPAPGPEEIYETAPAAPAPATPAAGRVPANGGAKAKPKPQAKPKPARLPPEQVPTPSRPDGTAVAVGTGGSESAGAVFSGRDLALVLAALAALAVLAGCARRLAVRAALQAP